MTMVFFLRFLVVLFGMVLRPFRRRWRPGRPIRCLLVGYGGANNTGAEAHADGAIRQMRVACGDRLDITVTSLNRERSLRYIAEDPRLHVVQIPTTFIFKLARLVARSDVVVLIEGYCFMQYFSQVLFWFFMFAADLAQRLRLVTVVYAVDAGELAPANASWAARVANRMDLLMMRTGAAVGVTRALGVDREMIVTADTAFTVEVRDGEWARRKMIDAGLDVERPTIGIAFEEFFWWPVVPAVGKFLKGQKEGRYRAFYYHTWSPERRRQSDDMKETMARFADWAGGSFNANIAFFAMERINEEPIADVMRRMVRPAVLFDADRCDAGEMAALLRSLRFLVAGEYHALILSMGAGVPVIGLGHDERISSVMAELGLKDDYYIHYTDDDVGEKLARKSERLMVEEEIVRARILGAMPSYLERMEANAQHFAAIMREKFIEKES